MITTIIGDYWSPVKSPNIGAAQSAGRLSLRHHLVSGPPATCQPGTTHRWKSPQIPPQTFPFQCNNMRRCLKNNICMVLLRLSASAKILLWNDKMCDKQDSTKYVWIFSWLCCRGDQTNTLLGKYGRSPHHYGSRILHECLRLWPTLDICGCPDYKWLEGTRSCRQPFSMRTLHWTLHKNTAPCSRILQAAAHTLVLIAVRCCASGIAADLRNVRDTNAQTGCQNSRLLLLDVERNLKTRFYWIQNVCVLRGTLLS